MCYGAEVSLALQAIPQAVDLVPKVLFSIWAGAPIVKVKSGVLLVKKSDFKPPEYWTWGLSGISGQHWARKLAR